MKNKIAVVVLNYCNAHDTIECLQSVLQSSIDADDLQIIIVDNNSHDDSMERIVAWLESHIESMKPMDDLFLSDSMFSNVCKEKCLSSCVSVNEDAPCRVVHILYALENNGYAFGNNIGIRLAILQDFDAVLIVNNDTILSANAIDAMTKRLFSKDRPGLCGSLLCYDHDRDIVQCRAGGRYNKWTGLSRLDFNGGSLAQSRKEGPDVVESHLDFIYGACVMASKTFIKEVGLLDESYFLYCEEQDWAFRAGGTFDLAYAPDALVYHKEGRSTGWSSHGTNLRALKYMLRSRLLLTLRHHPLTLPFVCMGIGYAGLRLLFRRLVRRPVRALLKRHHQASEA